jgi:hypothetical protein
MGRHGLLRGKVINSLFLDIYRCFIALRYLTKPTQPLIEDPIAAIPKMTAA